ncbi:hypothetical protein O6H91_Y034800 [Diphasiastrum complanatum]|nr:hypothetical protein O6H91_Y034800 [Diphasiastrum complanatum]
MAGKRWAVIFKSDALWQSALRHRWPKVEWGKRWPGPIGRGSSKRRYTALHLSKCLFNLGENNGDIDEVAGHAYLFLKEQLESATPLTYNLLHGTIIDQFLACGKSGSAAQDLASQIWLAVIDNMDGTERTFHLLMRIEEEWEVSKCNFFADKACVLQFG